MKLTLFFKYIFDSIIDLFKKEPTILIPGNSSKKVTMFLPDGTNIVIDNSPKEFHQTLTGDLPGKFGEGQLDLFENNSENKKGSYYGIHNDDVSCSIPIQDEIFKKHSKEQGNY